MRPYAIRMEYAKTAQDGITVIESGTPAVSWAVSAGADEAQDAHRVYVQKDEKVLWDTGFVGDGAQQARYAGEALEAGEVYTLVVQLRDASGRVTQDTRLFCPGTLERWPAEWLSDGEDRNCAVLDFFKDFDVNEEVDSACLFVCGLGYHKAYMNGNEIFTEPMNPAYSEYEEHAYYSVIPNIVLQNGINRVGIRVAAGWRNPKSVCCHHRKEPTAFMGRTVLSAALRIRTKDGAVRWLITDDTWRLVYDAISYADIFMGETLEAANRVPDWSKPQTELKQAMTCKIVECPTKKLTPQTLEPIREQEVYKPVTVAEVAPGVWGIDFGQNIAGVCRLNIPEDIPQGTQIQIRQIEFLDEDGRLYLPQQRRAAALDTYIAAGDERDVKTWQMEFTYHGFRYAEVTGYPRTLTKKDICAVSLYTDVAKESSFTCGSPTVNAFAHIARQTEKANIHSVLTDCPQRDERMGWMNDATARFEATPYIFDIGRLFPKVVRDLMDVQDETGAITCTAPFVYGSRPADPVCSSFLVAGWQSWLHTGNAEILKEAYSAFSAWNECLEAHSDDGIVNYSYYGDWAGPAYACKAPEDAHSDVTPGILMSTGYHYYNSCLLAKMAHVLNDSENERKWNADAARIRKAFLNKWYDPETACVGTGSQACQAFALWLDILPEEGRPKAAKLMRDNLEKKDYRFTTGNLCTRYLIEQLTRFGYAEDAWKLLTRDEYPSFGYMLQNEATTVWERYELKKDCSMNSHNHPMHASSYRYLYAYLLGIMPTGAGYETFSVKPYMPEKLLSASGSVETPYGDITLRWVKRYGEMHVYLNVPFGTKAEVCLPWGETVQADRGFHYWKHAL